MNSRAIAAKVLIRVLQEHHSLTATLDSFLAGVSSPQDKAFIQAISYGVLRHYFSLEALLNVLMPKPLKSKDLEIKLLALIGLYQLKYMRVKDYAAVSATVTAAKRQPWAKSLLNALFRRYLREQEVLDQLVQNHTNHPQWLVELIQQDWPDYADQVLATNNQQAPLSLRINQGRNSVESYYQKLADANLALQPSIYSPVGITLEQALPVDQIPDFTSGCVSVQDNAAQLAALLLDVQPGQRVLDLCAAPGGKTAHILEAQPELQELWAIDCDEQRLARVNENLRRLGLKATVKVGDATNTLWWDGKPFERILVDAPCSALGVIRRHPDIKFLRLPNDIVALQKLQQSILEQAWQVLAPNGILVYATCSILKAENEQQILNFLDQHDDAEELKIDSRWGLAASIGRQILPGMDDMDGFYYARLTKKS
jgi:16S rRNA (cytosine967-C5)-methyltransferase